MGVRPVQRIRIALAVGRRKPGGFGRRCRRGMRASFEGPCAVVEVAHEGMLAFGKMVGWRCCHNFDEQLPDPVDHSGDIWACGERNTPRRVGAFHARLPGCVGDGISPDTARSGSWCHSSASRLRTVSLQTMLAWRRSRQCIPRSCWFLAVISSMLVYKKPEMAAASGWLWPFSICAVLDAVTAAMAIVLVAIAVTQFTFWARVASTAVLVIGALCLGPAIGRTPSHGR